MKIKFFKEKSSWLTINGQRSTVRFSPFTVLRLPFSVLLLLCPVLLSAQSSSDNGVTVSNLAMNAGTVTFDVSWGDKPLPAVWSDTVWVFVDYNSTGTMTRLPLSLGATLTATSEPGIGRIIQHSDNEKGVWVVGNARSAGSFSATVKLSTDKTHLGVLCAYAINYPPVGRYTANDKITFTGTPPFTLTLRDQSTYTVEEADALDYGFNPDNPPASFTDRTLAPGTFTCVSPAAQTLQASAATYCEKSSVTLSLANTQAGAIYQLYKDGVKFDGVTVTTASGGAVMFPGLFKQGSYTVQTVAGAFCPAQVSGTVAVQEQALPDTPVLSASAGMVCQNGALIFGVTNPVSTNATYTWTASPGSQNGSSWTVTTTAEGAKTATAYVKVNAGGIICQSATSGKVTANVQKLPDTPVLSASAGAVCQTEALIFGVTNPESTNATYTWTASPGAQSTSSWTVTTTEAGAKTATVSVKVNNGGVICQSAISGKVTADVITIPAVPNIPSNNGPKCAGTGIQFTANKPGNATGIEWTGSVSGMVTPVTTAATTTGNYSAQVRSYFTSGGITCYSDYSGSSSGVINALPNINVQPKLQTLCSNQLNLTVAATPGSGSISKYQWKKDAVDVGTNSDTYTETVTGTPTHTYTVVVTDSSDCSTTSNGAIITVGIIAGGSLGSAIACTGTTPGEIGASTPCVGTPGTIVF